MDILEQIDFRKKVKKAKAERDMALLETSNLKAVIDGLNEKISFLEEQVRVQKEYINDLKKAKR